MLSFDLTDEQKEIRDWVHDFAEREIRPVAHQYDESEEFPWDVVKKAAKVGLYSVDFIQQTYADETGLLPALVAEELTWGCAGIALAITGTQLPVAAIFGQGTPEQIAEWIPKCYGSPDNPSLGAFAVTEAGAGSDGSSVALKTFEMTRPVVGAQALGIARAAFEFARDYAKERKQFGHPIIENQAIAFKLADMAMEIEAARMLVWRALWMSRHGGEFKMAEGSMAKLKCGEVAVKVTEEAIQILGGYGYIREFPVEKWHRDAKIYTLFEGTSEIQRLVISRAIAAA